MSTPRTPRMFAAALAIVALLAPTGCSSDATDPGADGPETTLGDPRNGGPTEAATVVTGRVYTGVADEPWAEAFAYDADGVITAVGSSDDVLSAAGDEARIVEGGPGMVMPGFEDAHVHIPEAGINDGLCLMDAGLTLEDYEAEAVRCAEESTTDEWVRAAGASLFGLRGTQGDKTPLEALERAVPDRPAVILDDLGHAAWTNSAGLEAAGIAEDTPDPAGGIIERTEDGRPTGLLLEDAQHLVRGPATPDEATVDEGMAVALEQIAAAGITTVSDAGGYWQGGLTDAWTRAADADGLTVRAVNSLYLYPDLNPDEQLAEFEQRYRNEPGDLLRVDTAKIYVDGILDLGTAAMIEPYDEAPDPDFPNGFHYFTADQLAEYAPRLAELGFRMEFHTIGDQANRDALDAIESIPEGTGEDLVHRTTHTYLVDPADLPRFAELGVAADVQAGPDTLDPAYREDLRAIIGDRADGLVPMAGLLDAGATLTLSSDWDADPLGPLGTIERALTRDREGVPDLGTAIEATTIGPARTMGVDDVTGTIEVGKQADYVVLSEDLFELESDQIDETQVLMTTVAGTEVFRAESFTG
ncbi:MAG: amidohydrolase [Microthrixaceae bacterium]